MMACERGHTTTVQALLEAGAGLNLQDTVVRGASLLCVNVVGGFTALSPVILRTDGQLC
jgi:hypothetical protein